jgi:hypothetical protein
MRQSLATALSPPALQMWGLHIVQPKRKENRPQHGSGDVSGGGTSGRGGLRGGKSEWRELGDPVTFSSEEVSIQPLLQHAFYTRIKWYHFAVSATLALLNTPWVRERKRFFCDVVSQFVWHDVYVVLLVLLNLKVYN